MLKCFIIGVLMIALVGLAHARVTQRDGARSGGGGTVAPAYYVSTTGNDSNPGTQALPFLTLGAAQAAMRASSTKSTLIHGGTYVLTTPLALTSADNGESWASYPGENAIISGGQDVTTGWTLFDAPNNVWRRTGTSLDFRELYINGVHGTRARGPSLSGNFPSNPAGWSYTPTGYTGPSGDVGTIAGYSNLTDVEIVSNGGFNQWRCQVASAGGTTITMQNSCWATAYYLITLSSSGWPQYPVWIENAYELLVTCGQGCWYRKRSTNELFYIPRGGEVMNTTPIIAPQYEHLLTGSGVSNLTFSRLTFAYTGILSSITGGVGYVSLQAGYMCTLSGCNGTTNIAPIAGPIQFTGRSHDITFDHNLFTHNAGRSLYLDHGSRNVTVTANKFTDNGAGAIQWGDITDNAETNPALQTTNLIFRNNYTGAEFEFPDTPNIFSVYATGTVIDHNEIVGPNWSGMQINWGWDNATSYAGGHSITNNYIHNYCYFPDCGGVYSNGKNVATSVTNSNYLLNAANTNLQGGLYSDQGTTNWTMDSNVLDNTSIYQFLFMNLLGASGNIHVTNTWTTNTGAYDGGTGNSVTGTVGFTSGSPPAGAVAIINNAGIQAGVTPGP